METLPTNLAADIQAANDSTPLADLVKLGVALAQARDTQHDTFQAALKLKNLIAPHMSEDPLKTLVGLKQCKTAGAASGGGVFSIMRDLDGNELEAWLDKPENLAGFAAGMEDAAAVLASPGVIHILGSIVAGWQTAIGAAPESVTEYSAAAESHRRISEAYKALIPGAQMWDDPGDVHTGLVAVMAAAKNKQLTGDPAAMAAAVVELSRGLEPMLSDPETMETLTTDREKMGAWIDSPIIMGAACSNANALEKLLASAIVIDELCKADSAGEARPGLRILLGSVIGARVFANTSLTSLKTLASSQLVMKTLVASRVAMEAVVASQVAMGAVVASQVAMGAVAASQVAMEEVAASYVAMRVVARSEVAMEAVMGSEVAMEAVVASQVAMEEVAGSRVAMRVVMGSEVAMSAVASSRVAMSAVARSYVSMEVVASSQVAMEEVAGSEVAMSVVADSQLAMEVVAATLTALKAIVANSTACSIVERSIQQYASQIRSAAWGRQPQQQRIRFEIVGGDALGQFYQFHTTLVVSVDPIRISAAPRSRYDASSCREFVDSVKLSIIRCRHNCLSTSNNKVTISIRM